MRKLLLFVGAVIASVSLMWANDDEALRHIMPQFDQREQGFRSEIMPSDEASQLDEQMAAPMMRNASSRAESTTFLLDSIVERKAESGEYVSKKEYSYDENGNETFGAYYKWSTKLNEWVGDYKNEFAYDENGNQTLYAEYSWSTEINDWVGYKKYEFAYDENGLQRRTIRYTCSEGQWIEDTISTYYYSEVNKIFGVEADAERIAIEGRNIRLGEPQMAWVYTMAGMEVFCGVAQEITVPSVGAYIVRTETSSYKILVK